MTSLVDRFGTIWSNIRQGATQMPSRVLIPSENVAGDLNQGVAFQRDVHYFQVRINEMYLTNSRQWFSQYDPMVFVVSEFTYDKKVEVVPYLVGPMMMEKYGEKIPTGMVFSDTRVAGLHPYRGGRLTLSVVLLRMKREDYARSLLQIVESAASSLDFSTALNTYVKVGSIVLDGVEALLGLGDTDAIIGFRKEFDPDAGELLQPSYFALIDLPESQLNLNQLWVRDNQLLFGSSLEDAKPFRGADYVLYSITQTSGRSDETTLPFYPLWERVIQEATVPEDAKWKSAKANMLTLYQTLVLSPDLTPKQADDLSNKYVTEMKRLHDRVVDMATLGPSERKLSEIDSKLEQAANILDL